MNSATVFVSHVDLKVINRKGLANSAPESDNTSNEPNQNRCVVTARNTAQQYVILRAKLVPLCSMNIDVINTLKLFLKVFRG